MADTSDIAQQPLPGPNTPDSGQYGEGAALDRLKQQLPYVNNVAMGGNKPGGGPDGPPPMPTPQPQGMNAEGRPPTGAAAPPGMPSVLLHPTQRPDVPVTTPLQDQPGMAAAQLAPEQAQTMTLMMLADDNTPGISAQTREWAKTLLRRMAVA